MDLEKVYDRVYRSVLWKLLRKYGVVGRLLREVQSFYESSNTCVKVPIGLCEWFPVCVDLRSGCVIVSMVVYSVGTKMVLSEK